uniref:ribose-phosphate diphosphokinase n=1 Tax=Prolemur simus TaxID=1328070 RepID=A0A8C9DP42_PROSS
SFCLKVFSGLVHMFLPAQKVVNRPGLELGKVVIKKFCNQKVSVETGESVRGQAAYVIQSSCGKINDTLMESLITINVCKTTWPTRKNDNIHRLFYIPVDDFCVEPAVLWGIQEDIADFHWKCIIVSLQTGGAKKVTSFLDRPNVEFALFHQEGRAIGVDRMFLAGDARGWVSILMDDMPHVAQHTMLQESYYLLGPLRFMPFFIHGIFSGSAVSRINNAASEAVDVTNTFPEKDKMTHCSKVLVIDISMILAEAIHVPL